MAESLIPLCVIQSGVGKVTPIHAPTAAWNLVLAERPSGELVSPFEKIPRAASSPLNDSM